MAVQPLFVASIEALKLRLRVGEVDKPGFNAQLEQAVEDVRLGFYDELKGLGASRVATLLAISYVENSTDATELLRTRANNLETLWVRLLLMKRQPTVFLDASGVTLEMWNDEPLVRKGERSLAAEIAAVESEVVEGLAYLRNGDEDDVGASVIVFQPSTTPDLPGASIYKNRNY